MISNETLTGMEPKAERASELLAAIAHPKRLLILCKLVEGECQAYKLGAAVGLSPATMSAHLMRLKALGLIAARRDGQATHYRLGSHEARKILTVLHEIYCQPPGAVVSGPM